MNAATGLLQARLGLARLGVARLLAAVVCVVGAVAWLQLLPQWRAGLQAQQLALQARAAAGARVAAPVVLPPSPARGLATFYDALGEPRFAEQQLKTMFAIAGDIGLALDKAEYKSAADANGRFHTYQIVLPVKGSYAQLRQFCEQMLAAIPFAALDEMNLRREAIGDTQLEGRLRFTLYLAEPASSVAAGRIAGPPIP